METAAKQGDMTHEMVAEKAGIGGSTIYRWRKGIEPNAKTIKKVAEAYDVDPNWLMNGDAIHITGDNNTIQNRVQTLDEALAVISQLTESLRIEQLQTTKAQEQVSELIALLKGKL